MRGRFITFEGVEGVGKSTQISHATHYLRARGIEPIVTREPGGTPLAENLRKLVLDPQHAPIGAAAEFLIFFAARASHVADVIRPALQSGCWVLCDRFTDATEAYQCGGRGVDRAAIGHIAQIAHPGLTPDLTFIFDAPAAIASARVTGRGTGHDRIEAEDTEFFERVRNAYLAIAAREPDRVRVVDARRSADEVAESVATALDSLASAWSA